MATKVSPAYVKQLPYSIGYVEYAYVLQNKDGLHARPEFIGQVRVAQRAELRAAAARANWAGAKDFFLVMTMRRARSPIRSRRRPLS